VRIWPVDIDSHGVCLSVPLALLSPDSMKKERDQQRNELRHKRGDATATEISCGPAALASDLHGKREGIRSSGEPSPQFRVFKV
jgi:hypothetical protein